MTNERKTEFAGVENLTLDDISILFSGEYATTTSKTFNQFVNDFWKYIAEVRNRR